MFLLNSRLSHFTAAPHDEGHPLSRSYRVNLPSSLAMIHSSTLEYSSRLPVSVYGTGGTIISLESFLGSLIRVNTFGRSLLLLSGFSYPGGFSCQGNTYAFYRPIPSGRRPFTPSSPHRTISRFWNIDQMSISFAVRLHLRSRLTLIRLTLIRKP